MHISLRDDGDYNMDQGGYTDTVQVYLRMVRESTAAHSPQCLRYVSRQSVHFSPSPPYGFPLDTTSTPHSAHLSQTEGQFSADYVFEAEEPLDSICEYVCLDPGKLNCVLSLGNSDLMNGSQGLIANYIRKIVELNGKITIGCVGFIDGKVTNYLSEAYMAVNSLEEVVRLAKETDLFQSRKQRRGLLIFSVFHQRAGGSAGTQFIEATHPSSLLDQLLYTLTNANQHPYPLNAHQNMLFDILYRSICYQSRVIVIGNVSSGAGNTAWVLSVTANLMEGRRMCRTFLTSLWMTEIETLEKQGENMIKGGSDKEYRHRQAILPLKQEINALNQALKAQKYLPNKPNMQLSRLELELNDLKNLHLLRETAINELKEQIKDLESELELRNYGISTQFRDSAGSFDETIEKLRRENEELRRKNGVLEVNVSALKAFLAPKARAEAWTQIFARPLALYFPTAICVPGHRQERDLLAEELLATKREVERVRTQISTVPNAVEDEERQCKALYRLLTESWRYSDAAIRRFKQAFDQMNAAMQLAICDRDLKEAEIEYRISKASIPADKLQNLERKAAAARQTETAMRELQGKLAEKEAYLLRKKEKFASYAHALKTSYKTKQKEVKEGKGTRELQALKEEIEEKQEEREMELRRVEKDRRELHEQIAALRAQIQATTA